MITVVDCLAWRRWVAGARDEVDKKAREARVEKYVFPDGLDEEQKRERQAVVDYAVKMPLDGPGLPPAVEPPDGLGSSATLVAPEFKKLEWEGFTSRNSLSYRRGSLHDGTAEELDRMRERSSGSPFDAEKDPFADAKAKRKRGH